MNEFIEIDDAESKRFKNFFDKLTNQLRDCPSSKDQEKLIDKASYFSNEITKNNGYNEDEFLAFSDDFIHYFTDKQRTDKAINAISLLCLIHCRVSDLYQKYNITYDIGRYFRAHWQQYAYDKNSTIIDLILFYYYKKYADQIGREFNYNKISQSIMHDEYLSSECGIYQKKTIILWLYNEFFSKTEYGIPFLETFSDDSTIRKKISAIQQKNS